MKARKTIGWILFIIGLIGAGSIAAIEIWTRVTDNTTCIPFNFAPINLDWDLKALWVKYQIVTIAVIAVLIVLGGLLAFIGKKKVEEYPESAGFSLTDAIIGNINGWKEKAVQAKDNAVNTIGKENIAKAATVACVAAPFLAIGALAVAINSANAKKQKRKQMNAFLNLLG